MLNCPNCRLETDIKYKNVFDHRFGIPGYWHICSCKNCGWCSTLPMPSETILQELYKDHYNFSGDESSTYARIRKMFFISFYSLWLRIDGDVSFFLEKGRNRTLLDVGCNEGRTLKIYSDNGFLVHGIEANPVAGKSAKKKGFQVFIGDLTSFKSPQKHDVVVLSNVLEHISNPRPVLNKIFQILSDEGELWISLPNRNSMFRKLFKKHWINWHVPFHYFHFDLNTLKDLLSSQGFTIFHYKTVSPSLWISLSLLSLLFSKPSQKNKFMRNPIIVGIMSLTIRFFSPILLFIINKSLNGDCIVAKFKKCNENSIPCT
jgi:SAM-dependent methyltransferase